jgi:hypothetical protein
LSRSRSGVADTASAKDFRPAAEQQPAAAAGGDKKGSDITKLRDENVQLKLKLTQVPPPPTPNKKKK